MCKRATRGPVECQLVFSQEPSVCLAEPSTESVWKGQRSTNCFYPWFPGDSGFSTSLPGSSGARLVATSSNSCSNNRIATISATYHPMSNSRYFQKDDVPKWDGTRATWRAFLRKFKVFASAVLTDANDQYSMWQHCQGMAPDGSSRRW